MPTQEELREITENLNAMSISIDGTFNFSCSGCGNCCKHREDILLNARDIFNIAKQLGMTTAKVQQQYGDTYIGQSSRIPVIRLAPKGPQRICPMLVGNRCKVHAAKPIVCALFPLGRYIACENEKGSLSDSKTEIGYVLMPTACGDKHTITVRSWLDSFGIPVEDPFFISWHECVLAIGGLLKRMEEQQLPLKGVRWLQRVFEHLLYLEYDTKEEFLPQFEANKGFLIQLIAKLQNSPAGIEGALEHLIKTQGGN